MVNRYSPHGIRQLETPPSTQDLQDLGDDIRFFVEGTTEKIGSVIVLVFLTL